MKKILGLDLGVTSIGWAYIQEKSDNEDGINEIIGLGCRIIPLSSDENDEFTKGNAQTTNAERRFKRGARRNLQRYKLRKHYLTTELKKAGMFPSNELFNLNKLELYGLRSMATEKKLGPEEIGRLFYMINQKRGYKSNRKANKEEESETRAETVENNQENSDEQETRPRKKNYLDLISDREAILAKEDITVGQYFYRELQKNPHFRVKENIFLRSSYIKEFERIWNFQQQFYPETLTNELKDRIQNRIIFYQRNLKSQKALVSDCRFEKRHKATPKSSPLFQTFRIWQDLNNIEIISFKGFKGVETDQRFNRYGRRELTPEEKKAIAGKLATAEKITRKELLKLCGYKLAYDEYSLNLQKDLEGNRTVATLKKHFDKLGLERNELLQFKLTEEPLEASFTDEDTGEITGKRIINRNFEAEPLHQLWHLLYSVEDPDVLVKSLVKKYRFTPEQAKALAKIDFHRQGYGSLSSRAIRNILPYLLDGKKYPLACKIAGYRHSDFITTEENLERQLYDKLEIIQKGSLRNPVVEKILNQVVNLVNDILDAPEYERPDEIRIELARELRQNAEERKRTFKKISDQNKKHKSIEDILHKELGFARVSRKDIERYKLWEEFGRISPYEPGKPVSLTELYNGGYDIEHIIPKSRIFDDSFSNKTICPRSLNAGETGKNQMTAYDFMQARGEQILHDYVELVTRAYKNHEISKLKFERLMMPAEKIPDDFINRQLAETRYISSEVKKMLMKVCRNVYSTSGAITAELRHQWGYDDITMELNREKYEQSGLTYSFSDKDGKVYKRLTDWNKRDDHRHHAIDALVIACTKQAIIQRLNNLNQAFVRKENSNQLMQLGEKLSEARLENDIMNLRVFEPDIVKKSVAGILISFKSGKRVAIMNRNNYEYRKGEKHVQQTITPRGYLHKETIYGRINQYEEIKLTTRFNALKSLAFQETREFLLFFLGNYENNPKLAFSAKGTGVLIETLKKNQVKGLSMKEESVFATCLRQEFVVRYPLESLKAKDLPYVVDKKVRDTLQQRIEELGEKTAFKDLAGNPVWHNKEKGIAIKSARVKTGLEGLVPLHSSKGGNTFSGNLHDENSIKVDFVSTRNNHHIAIYRDSEGNLQENVVTLWDAFNRKRLGIPVIVKNPASVWDYVLEKDIDEQDFLIGLPQQDWNYIVSMQQNQMFVFGMDREILQEAIDKGAFNSINPYLFRVQAISSKYYEFTHHLETKKDNSLISIKLGKFLRITNLEKMTGIKVKIDRLGRILGVEE